MILPQIPLYGIALICGLLSFFVTRLTMPRMIRKLEAANIVGKDIHKSWKPIVAEMGGFGILFGFIIGMFSGNVGIDDCLVVRNIGAYSFSVRNSFITEPCKVKLQ